MIPSAAVIDAVSALFTEAFEGPPDAAHTWFTDNEPGSGLFGTLDRLTAAEASTPPGGAEASEATGAPGATVAAHVEHLRWSLALSNALARGERPAADWEESWSVRAVDAPEWDRLREALRSEYRAMRDDMRSRADLPAALVTPGIALVAHAAYHLGAIRQLARALRGG